MSIKSKNKVDKVEKNKVKKIALIINIQVNLISALKD